MVVVITKDAGTMSKLQGVAESMAELSGNALVSKFLQQ
jgi:hypothetical protein